MPKSKSVRHQASSLRGIRRDRDCQYCKARGVKCDLNRPRCLPCVESGLECGGYPQRIVWTRGPKASKASKASSSTTLARGGPPTDVMLSNSPEQILRASADKPLPPSTTRQGSSTNDGRDWLLEKLSAVCRNFTFPQQSVWTEQNRLHQQHQQLPTSLPLLVSRVDQFLRAHMTTDVNVTVTASLSYPPPRPSVDDEAVSEGTLENDTVEIHQLAALTCLSQAVETADPVAFVGMLAFAFLEVTSDGPFGHWQRHLRGARSLLDHLCHGREQFQSLSRSVTGLPEMIAYFCWWDTAGTVIRRLAGSSDSAEGNELIFLDWHRDVMGKGLFNAVGCPQDTFQLFVNLAKVSNTRTIEEELQSRDQAIGQLLQLGLDGTHRGRCRDAWRCAAAIAVLTWQQNPIGTSEARGAVEGGSRQATLQCAVERVCQILPVCSPSSRFYAHMAEPVFLAAIHATSPQQCRVLSKYWSNCCQGGGFPRYSGVLGQCEEMWRSKGLV